MQTLDLKEAGPAVRMRVRVKPRASRSALVGVREGVLEVAVAAPPVDGLANAELVAFLAKRLGVAKKRVSLVSGESARIKLLSIQGLEPAEIRRLLAGGKDGG